MAAREILRGQGVRPAPARVGQRPRAQVVSDTEVCEDCGIAIGACGCGGGMATGSVTSRGSTVMPAGTVFGGVQAGVGVNRAQAAADARARAEQAAAEAAAAEAAAQASGDWTVGLQPNPGCYPRGMHRTLDAFGVMLADQAGRPAPYSDPIYDFCNMDSLYSDITDVAAGATVNITVEPNQGTFGAFYWDIVAVDDATGVEVNDWENDQPFVQGCPTPCDVNGPILAQFSQQTPEQCCGKPFRAFLDEESRNAPLNIPFTNNQGAGTMRVQVRVRGYCCSSKVCW